MAPDKHIRKEVAEKITAAAGVLVTEQVVPIAMDTPEMYVLISSQTRNRTAVSKQNYEWLGSITLTLVKINEKGYISSAELDDLGTQVCAVMDELEVPGFKTNFSRFFDSVTDVIEGPANTMCRKHIIYEIWVNRVV